jgi:hypothetical protein
MMTSPPVPGAAEDAPPMDEFQSRSAGWSFAHRVAFRFVFSLLVLCVFPLPFSTSPGSVYQTTRYDKFWFVLASWVGSHILHVPPTPSSFSIYLLADTTAGYVTLLCFMALVVLTTLVWTHLDGKRLEYRKLHEWLRIYVRYALAFTMLAYGRDNIFALQFAWSLPGPERLAEPLGNYSPFALIWTFMGYSASYTIFTGIGEVIGGVLLFFRHTTPAPSLIR